jgi:hypothetical protein
MGTRHLICVVKNGQYKVAQYGQWDGYPEGQGVGILNFLTNEMNRELFEKKLDDLKWATEEDFRQMHIDIGLDPNKEWVNMDEADLWRRNYPENDRDTGSVILSIIQNSKKTLKLRNSLDFAADSLYCEWAYVIDLDKNTFEVYKGFNEKPLTEEERFYNMEQVKYSIDCEYYPVKHIISFELNNLPSEEEFKNGFKNNEEEVC